MAKPTPLKWVKYVRAKGRIYAYFMTGQKVAGREVLKRMPDWQTAEFWTRYSAMRTIREGRARAAYTVAVMAGEYRKSAELASKAPATQRLYAVQLARITDTLGLFGVDDIRTSHVQTVLDKEGWGIGTRNAFIGTLGALYQWGRRRGKASIMPTRDIERIKGGEYEPWPKDILERGLAEPGTLGLAVHLLYYTGQRIGDVCRMRWGDISRDFIRVRQQKTGKDLEVTLADALRAVLDMTPRRGLTILSDDAGRPYRIRKMRDMLQAFTRAHGIETVPHGLRKNAVNALLEAGCTIPEVSAITGQTPGMIDHYARRVNRRALGKAAIVKLQARSRT